MDKMQVIQVRQFGGPEVLVTHEVPDPVAGPGDVVIEVAIVPVLFIDAQIRSGRAKEWFPVRPPYVPGVGVAGTVISVGQGVDPDWVGRRVVSDTGEDGGYAEQAVVPAQGLLPVPEGLDLSDAAAVLHDGRTALRLIEVAKIQPGEWVLITSAAGGLGALLVQLARAAGGRVIGVVRGERKLDLARQLGAEVLADYTEPNWPDQVLQATEGHGADVILDGVGGHIGGTAFRATATGVASSPTARLAEGLPRSTPTRQNSVA